MKKNLHKLLKSLIMITQDNSDRAKHFNKLFSECFYYEYRWLNKKKAYYTLKQKCLDNIISILNGMKHSRIKYNIVKDLDQNGYESFIYYFEWKEHGKTYQFSFHSFKPVKVSGNKTITWDHGDCRYNRRAFSKGGDYMR